jgi:FtsP/CotA-like multicopper oxidase with cupredoxin domain
MAERIQTHDNERPAGVRSRGALTLRLEARAGRWYPHADTGPFAEMLAFAEVGKPLQIPGPLIRAPSGTDVVASIRNGLSSERLIVHGLVSRPVTSGASDTLIIGPGSTREVRFRLDTPGNYYYWATSMGRDFMRRTREDAQLSGAIIVDDASVPPRRDHVLVISGWSDTTESDDAGAQRRLLVVNGRSWPHTSRLHHTVGDSIRFRLINTSTAGHPMHLHGSYFHVDSRGDGMVDTTYDSSRRDLVTTERVRPGATTSVTWVSNRPGNWLFHCQIPRHSTGRGALGMPRDPSVPKGLLTTGNYAMDGMSGLVVGIHVKPRAGSEAITVGSDHSVRRRLRLLVRPAGGTSTEPYYAFTLHESGDESAPDTSIRSGPPIVLTRGEPVSIMVINRTREPTAVHWHGMELDSYFDGVPGFSGGEERLSPIVAPTDSFDVRFTPPRSGTFIYHSHVDEPHQLPAGLAGALIVIDPHEHYDATTDIPILISTPLSHADAARTVIINGRISPQPVALRMGLAHRFRIINITVRRAGMRVELWRGDALAQWRPIAKDGAALPIPRQIERSARQPITLGETFDFEVTPREPGEMRLEMRTGNGLVIATVPIIVQPQ